MCEHSITIPVAIVSTDCEGRWRRTVFSSILQHKLNVQFIMNFYTVTRAYHTKHKICIKSTIGPPLHLNISFRTFLHDCYPERLVDGGGRNDWPAKSPDKTPLFFCLWGNFQDYACYVHGTAKLQPRVQDKCQ
jgi:hypothetical protein